MDLVTESDLYAPSMDESGNYVDKIPSFHIIKKGLLCPCGSRKDKLYDNHSTFSAHVKTKTHQKWITGLNLNKINYYVENEKLNDTIQNQRLIIAKLEKDVGNKIMTIDYLTQQLNKNKTCVTVNDLIDFN